MPSHSIPLPPWPPDWPEIEAAAVQAIRSSDWGRYRSTGCQRLKEELAERFAAEEVRLCCSGTAAIELALRAAGVGPGDEVILAAYDYPGNLRCVELVGAQPVLVDVQAGSPTLRPADLAEAASDRVAAVIASHLFGQPAEIAVLAEECHQRGWTLIEDACQVPGMSIDRRPAGSFGDLAALSFGGSKPLTAGSGGALLSHDRRVSARLGPLLDRPSDAFPLSPLQAAVIRPQLQRLDEINARRNETARRLVEHLRDQTTHWQWLPTERPGVVPAHYKLAWAARSPEHRERLLARAAELGLPIGAGFRAADRLSARRCRKPLPLPSSRRFGETLLLLDHTALLIEPSQRRPLANLLQRLHDETASD